MTNAFSRLAFVAAAFLVVPSTAAHSGDPIPGVDVSLEQIPGGRYATVGQCRRNGGAMVRRSGKTYCARRAKTAIRHGTPAVRYKPRKKRRRRQSF
ncbi:MAG: hypothetical protein AAF441_06360 [Pseudomonadota bacterium]